MKVHNKVLFTLLASGLLLFGFAASAQAPVEKPLAQFEGKPTFSEGTDTGYYVWCDGDKWSVRWTTTGKLRHFTGAVTAEGGELKSLKRIDVESESRVLYPGRAPRIAVGPRGRVYRRGGVPPVVASREQDRFEKDGEGRIVFNSRTDDDIDALPVEQVTNLFHCRRALAVYETTPTLEKYP